ncbi:hypothetical protein Vadar_027858 [Vaccinium darrowii]|uniref:Uncharacterized protein n=1 Tax=Vaccinium darrowii TaxID=229202 RepID=A0ACB7XV58_9ERIC|nr:hypothetical protein Vadar_027858 [Vaccinium darrowii]
MKRSELACLSLLLLMMLIELEITTPCLADNKFSKFKGRSQSDLNSLKHQKDFKGKEHKNGVQFDDVFGAEKRKVYTGPNPLHNR